MLSNNITSLAGDAFGNTSSKILFDFTRESANVLILSSPYYYTGYFYLSTQPTDADLEYPCRYCHYDENNKPVS